MKWGRLGMNKEINCIIPAPIEVTLYEEGLATLKMCIPIADPVFIWFRVSSGSQVFDYYDLDLSIDKFNEVYKV